LAVVAPTRTYGYVANGENATPAVETRYMGEIRDKHFPMLAKSATPISTANFLTYGVSSTPTLVLVDQKGIVRYYHPGAASELELSNRIKKILMR
jgi:hypothetical protein